MARRAGLLLLMMGASSPAWASYRDGFFGLVVLFFALPAALGLLLLAGLMREAGCFARAPGRRLFLAAVAALWLGLLLWSLSVGDGFSTALVGGGVGLLAVLASAPAWWRQPWPAIAAANPPGRHWLAVYWIASGLWPLVQSAPPLLRAQLPADALLWALLPVLVFGAPRWLGATALLRQRRSAQAWLTLALFIAVLGLASAFAAGAPEGLLLTVLGLLALDMLVWALGFRLPASGP